MKIKRNNKSVIGGHLIMDTNYGDVYDCKKGRFGLFITDSAENKIFISRGCQRRYFTEI